MGDAEDDTTAYDEIMWIPKVIALGITVIVVVALIYMYAFQDLKTDVVEMQLIIQELYSSPYAFAYQDNLTKAVYPGTIDVNKFNSVNLDDLIKTNIRFAIKVELRNDTKLFEGKAGYLLGTKYFISGKTSPDEADFSAVDALKNFPERVSKLKTYPLIKPVNIIDGNKLSSGVLIFYVLEQK